MSGPTGTTVVLDGDGLEAIIAELRERGYTVDRLGDLEAIALGGAVERMPSHLRRIGVEPHDLGWGEGLSEPVERSIEGAAGMILDYLRTRPGD